MAPAIADFVVVVLAAVGRVGGSDQAATRSTLRHPEEEVGGSLPRRSSRRRLRELRMRGRRDLIRREGRDGRVSRYHLPPYER